MKRLRGCLVVAFIFGSGFLVGGFLGAAFGWVSLFHKVVKGGPRAAREVIVQRANDDLGLTASQRAAVEKIVNESAAQLGDATAGVRPQVEEILGRAEARVREVLDAKQREKFDAFANKSRRRWKAAQEIVEPQPPATPNPAESPLQPATPQPEAVPEKNR
jgi:uncharacterized membrane protein